MIEPPESQAGDCPSLVLGKPYDALLPGYGDSSHLLRLDMILGLVVGAGTLALSGPAAPGNSVKVAAARPIVGCSLQVTARGSAGPCVRSVSDRP